MRLQLQTVWLERRRGVDHVHVLVGTALAAPADLFDLVTEKESGVSQGSISSRDASKIQLLSLHSKALLAYCSLCWQLVSCC